MKNRHSIDVFVIIGSLDLNIAEHIVWLGQRTDIRVLPSHEEGLSNAVVEGMTAGLPMVVTDVGGNAELVVNGNSGLVVAPHSPSDLGDAIATLAVDTPLRYAMGTSARARPVRDFSVEDCVHNYRQAYMFLGLTPRKFRHS